MPLANRIQKVRSHVPSREDWEYKLERIKKFPNNPEKRYCNETGIKIALIAERGSKDYTPDQLDVAKLFRKILGEYFPQYLSNNFFTTFDQVASYDDVERLFEIAMRYANNWAFS